MNLNVMWLEFCPDHISELLQSSLTASIGGNPGVGIVTHDGITNQHNSSRLFVIEHLLCDRLDELED